MNTTVQSPSGLLFLSDDDELFITRYLNGATCLAETVNFIERRRSYAEGRKMLAYLTIFDSRFQLPENDA